MRIEHAQGMYGICMTYCSARIARSVFALACVVCCFAITPTSAWSQGEKAPSPEKGAQEKPAEKAALPPLPQGWTRTFLLYADGFSKEMDINSASPDQVSPLPFHGMTKYPYDPPETYPLTEARRAYIERYNTRLVASEVSSIDSTLLDSVRSGASR